MNLAEIKCSISVDLSWSYGGVLVNQHVYLHWIRNLQNTLLKYTECFFLKFQIKSTEYRFTGFVLSIHQH